MPSKRYNPITPELLDKIVEMLRRGLFRSSVYNSLGIGKERFDGWLQSNKAFRAAVLKAEHDFFIEFQERWLAAGRGSLSEMKAYMEKRFADELTVRQKLQVEETRPTKVILKRYALKAK